MPGWNCVATAIRAARGLARALLGAVALAGCTLLSDFDVKQCSADADCRSLEGPALHCQRSRCVPGCNSNSECAAADPLTPLCTSSGGTCVSLNSAGRECYANTGYRAAGLGDRTAAETTVIGAFAPTVRSSTWLSVSLAVDEINAFIRVTNSTAAPVLAVLCSDAEADLPRSVKHLVDTLGARAVMGSMDDASLRLALAEPTARERAVFLSPGSAPVAPSAQSPLSWHLGGLQRDVVTGYTALVERAITRARTTGSLAPRVLSVVAATPEDSALADLVEENLLVEGYDVVSASALDRYRRLDLDDEDVDAREQALRDVITYAPDVVLVFLGGDFRAPEGLARGSFVAALSEAQDAGSSVPLSYILAPHARDDQALRDLARTSPSFRAGALGLDARPRAERAVLDAAQERFDQAYPRARDDMATARLAADVYDALYLLFYARLSAAREAQRDASATAALHEALQRIGGTDGSPVMVGPGAMGLDTGVPLLLRGEPINVITTSGALRFDGVTRARRADVAVWCWSDTGTPEGDIDLNQLLLDTAAAAAPCSPGIDNAP